MSFLAIHLLLEIVRVVGNSAAWSKKRGISQRVIQHLCWGARIVTLVILVHFVNKALPGTEQINDPQTYPFYAAFWEGGAEKWHFISNISWLKSYGFFAIISAVAALGVLFLVSRTLKRRSVPYSLLQRIRDLILLCLLCIICALSLAAFPKGVNSSSWETMGSFIRPWFNAGSTMVFDIRNIESEKEYLENFTTLQKSSLKIHAASHPPGASLLLYWIGRLTSHSKFPDFYHYAIGHTVLCFCNIFIIYLLGFEITRKHATAFLAAALFGLSPAMLIYANFAIEALVVGFYAVALWLMYRLPYEKHRGKLVCNCIALGCVFFLLAMVTYSWCLVTTIFTLWIIWLVFSRQLHPLVAIRKWGYPLLIFAAVWFSFLLVGRFDYYTAFVQTLEFEKYFYVFSNWKTVVIAFIGGQLLLWFMMGPVTAGLAVSGLTRCRSIPRNARALFFLQYAIILTAIMLNDSLKVETGRCWNWALLLPFIFAAIRDVDDDSRLINSGPLLTLTISWCITFWLRMHVVFWA